MSQGQPPQYPSNVPPQNYPPQNPPGNYPPGAYPPGAYPPGGAVPPRGTSVSSVFSLIFGILGCVPIVTSLLAVILGFVGIKATKNGARSGRPMAIIGLILGLLGLAGWGLFGGSIFTAWYYTKPARATAQQFITDLANGNAAAAQARCTSDISKDDIDQLIAYIKPMGPVKDVTSLSFNVNAAGGPARSVLGGAVTFANGPKPYTMTLVKDPSGQFKVAGVQFDPKQPGQ